VWLVAVNVVLPVLAVAALETVKWVESTMPVIVGVPENPPGTVTVVPGYNWAVLPAVRVTTLLPLVV
jgi:hypothetical protein